MLRRDDEVLAAAASLDLLDLETVKDELSVSKGDILSDAQYLRYIAQVSADIHNEIDPRVLPIQSYRSTFRWDFGLYQYHAWCRPRYETELTLPQYPVTSISAVTADGVALDTSDYQLSAKTGQLRRLSGGIYVPWCASEIIVDFTAGYSTIPADIIEAALLIITMLVKSRNRDPMLKAKETDATGRQEFWVDVTPNMRGGMPTRAAQIIDRYRPVLVG